MPLTIKILVHFCSLAIIASTITFAQSNSAFLQATTLKGQHLIVALSFAIADTKGIDDKAFIGSISFNESTSSIKGYLFSGNKNQFPCPTNEPHGFMNINGKEIRTPDAWTIKTPGYDEEVEEISPYSINTNGDITIELKGHSLSFSLTNPSQAEYKISAINTGSVLSPINQNKTAIFNVFGIGFLAPKDQRQTRINHSDMEGSYTGSSYRKSNSNPFTDGEWELRQNGFNFSKFRVINQNVKTSTYKSPWDKRYYVHSSVLLNYTSNKSIFYTDGGHDYKEPEGGVWDSLGHTQMFWAVPERDKSVNRVVAVEYFYQTSGHPIIQVSGMTKQ